MPASFQSLEELQMREGVGPRLGFWLDRAALLLALAVVVTRVTILEAVRDPFNVTPESAAYPRGPNAGTSLLLDLLAFLPAILVLARRAIDRRFALRFSPAAVAMAALGAWIGLSVCWADDKFGATVSAANFSSALALAWALSQLVRSWRRGRLVAGVCLGLLLVFIANAAIYKLIELPDMRSQVVNQWADFLKQRGWSPDSFSARQFLVKVESGELVGFTASANSFAALLVLCGCVVAGLAIQRKADGDRAGWPAAIGVAGAAGLIVTAMTASKAAIATAVIAAGLFVAVRLLRRPLGRQATLGYGVGVAAVCLAMAAAVGHGLFHHGLPTASLNFRWRYWVGAWAMFKAHPWLGTGWDNFGARYLKFRLPIASEEIKDPHNYLVRAFTELGIIGGGLFIAWLLATWRQLSRAIVPIIKPGDPADRAPALRFEAPGLSPVVAMPLAIAGSAFILRFLAGTDWDQPAAYTAIETIKAILYAALLFVGVLAATVRLAEPDHRPAPWVLYAMVIGLGAFLLHNLVEFSLFEPGGTNLFALVLGAAMGLRGEDRPRRPTVITLAGLGVSTLTWIAMAAGVALPISLGEADLSDGDTKLRAKDFSAALASYAAAASAVPYNAAYERQAAAAAMYGNAPPPEIRRRLDDAIARDPSALASILLRAHWTADRRSGNDAATAREDFSTAVSLNPCDVDTHVDFGDFLASQGDPGGAAAQYRAALAADAALDPQDAKRLAGDRLAELRAKAIQGR